MQRLTWSVLWLASLLIVAGLTSGLIRAQATDRILSGSDIGFRLEGTDRAGTPLGTFMLRVNGEWVEASISPKVRALL